MHEAREDPAWSAVALRLLTLEDERRLITSIQAVHGRTHMGRASTPHCGGNSRGLSQSEGSAAGAGTVAQVVHTLRSGPQLELAGWGI